MSAVTMNYFEGDDRVVPIVDLWAYAYNPDRPRSGFREEAPSPAAFYPLANWTATDHFDGEGEVFIDLCFSQASTDVRVIVSPREAYAIAKQITAIADRITSKGAGRE